MLDAASVLAHAKQELEVENYKEAVEAAKVKLRRKQELQKSFWYKIFPWRITIVRAEDHTPLIEKYMNELKRKGYTCTKMRGLETYIITKE